MLDKLFNLYFIANEPKVVATEEYGVGCGSDKRAVATLHRHNHCAIVLADVGFADAFAQKRRVGGQNDAGKLISI